MPLEKSGSLTASLLKKQRRSIFSALLRTAVLILVALSPQETRPQTRQIKIIVPLPPGGAGDSLALLLAEQVGRARGPAVVIQNPPAAGSVIGPDARARAAAHWTTLPLNA